MACAAGTPRTSGQDCPARGRAGGRLATSEVVFALSDKAAFSTELQGIKNDRHRRAIVAVLYSNAAILH
jgi:hypothetical protein